MKLTALLAMALLTGPLAAATDPLEEKFEALKDAVASKDTAQVKKLSLDLFPLVTQGICETAPEDESEKAEWKSRVDHAKGVGQYAEYALFAVSVGSPAATQVDLISTLEKENPKSPYLDNAYGAYLVALTQTGKSAEVVPIAEKAVANFPENEDLLLVLADAAVSNKQSDRALTYANRLVAAVARHPKPENVPAAEWERKRSTELGRGYWIAGVIYGERNQYVNADKNLRAALPLVQGSEPMMAAALFHLGTANYQIGKMTLSKARILEGIKFSEQCAGIVSAYAVQAHHNALVMKSEVARMR